MTSILTRDLLMNILLGLAALVIVMMSSINPAQDDATKQIQAGNIAAYIAWPDGDIDVDLWVSGPGDAAIGYSNKSGKVWSLLRDDIGTNNDGAPFNYETAFTRGMPDGEYRVNVRCFRCGMALPVNVSVEVRTASGELIWKGVVVLAYEKQEKTAIAWTMQNGAVVRDSLNSVTKELVK